MIDWTAPSDLDRVDHRRGQRDWVAGLWHGAEAQLLRLDVNGGFPTRSDGAELAVSTPTGSYDDQRHHLLGLLDEVPVFCVQEEAGESTEPDGSAAPYQDLRQLGHRLRAGHRDLAAAAAAVSHWHRSAPNCPRCGGPTQVIRAGFARHCVVCDEEHFPRTDPAVIVAVVDADDRLLLGGQASWGNRVSVLAGFVEAGESLEQTVHREIGEESQISLSEISYFGSQPWPFPRSLMVGFFARAVSTAIDVAADELSHAAWWERQALTAALDSGRIGLPGPSSIAFRLIEAWRSGRSLH